MTVSKRMSVEVIKKSIFSIVILFILIALFTYYKLSLTSFLSEQTQQNLKKYMITIFILYITYIIQKVFSAALFWYQEKFTKKTASRLDDELIPLMRRTFKIILWIIAILLVLPYHGINITALIAALGVSSLAIALAAQDTIANIIAGFLIMIDRPFKINDKIKIPTGETVKVLDIGIRRSKFLSEDSAIIIVPNVDLSKSKIVNYTYGE